MANTLGGLNLGWIAEESIAALTPELLALTSFTTDFSENDALPYESVTTRIPTATTADDISSGFTGADVTSTAVTVTLNQELGKAIRFTQRELTVSGEEKLMRLFRPIIVNAVGLGIIRTAINLMTTAAYSSETTITAANFDADDVADIATTLDTANVMKLDRGGIMKPNYFGSLVKDDSIQDVSASGSDEALREHNIRRLSGFNLFPFNGFPTTGTTATENLEAMFFSPQAIAMAAAFPAMTQSGREVVQVENVIEPVTGFPFQFQEFYVPTERQSYLAIATLFGVSVGSAGSLTRVVSS